MLMGQACDTGLLGACSSGTTACVEGATVCVPQTTESDEVCNGMRVFFFSSSATWQANRS